MCYAVITEYWHDLSGDCKHIIKYFVVSDLNILPCMYMVYSNKTNTVLGSNKMIQCEENIA